MVKFEDIDTAAKLIDYITIHGTPMDNESICKMQDIIGHTAIEDLDFLANNATRNKFYSLLFNIWHWEDAVRFWNEHTNPDREAVTQAYEQNRKLKKMVEELKENNKDFVGKLTATEKRNNELTNKAIEQERRAIKAEEENFRLKAKLYDLMMAKEENANEI